MEYYNGHLLALTVAGDGTATGCIVGTTAFMALRGQRIPWVPIAEIVTEDSEAHAEDKLSRRHPRCYVASYDLRTAIGVQVAAASPATPHPTPRTRTGSCGYSTNGCTPGQRSTTSTHLAHHHHTKQPASRTHGPGCWEEFRGTAVNHVAATACTSSQNAWAENFPRLGQQHASSAGQGGQERRDSP